MRSTQTTDRLDDRPRAWAKVCQDSRGRRRPSPERNKLEKLPRKPDIGSENFFEVDLRAGRVVEVADFPEARKPSLKVTVDFGPVVGVLTTSAQIAQYGVEELEGRMVVGAINLGEKRIAGFKSQFLILGALDPDGTVRLLQLEEGVEPGAPIA